MNKILKSSVAILLAGCMTLGMVSCGSKSDSASSADGTYTYRTSTTSPNTWSPTDWENETESAVQSYTSTYLYSFELNEDKTGYTIYPDAAAEMPEDVTANLTAEQKELYGIDADATEGYAWTIQLKEGVCWEDGTEINADDYVYTIQQFLNPEMKNYRASQFYEGTTGLANAKAYYSSGGFLYTNATETYEPGTALADIDQDLYFNTGEYCEWWDGTIDSALSDGYEDYFYLEDGTLLTDKYDADTDIKVDDALVADLEYICEVNGDVAENWIQFCSTVEEAPETPWEDVGLIKNDDYSLTFVFTNPTTQFYVCYSLPFTLVNEDLYEANKKDTSGLVKSSYGTTADTYMSYGPYKIESYQEGKEMILTKNENWYGYSDEHFDGKYQTTDINIQYIDSNETTLSLFLQGNLDDYSVSSDQMETYANSDYIYFLPTTYSYMFTFNCDEDALKSEDGDGVNHSILSLQDFRKAITYSLDRQAFVDQCLAGSDPGYGLINYVYVDDPDTGELYRNSEHAANALCKLYDVDSESEITGYDKTQAAELFQSAYDAAVENGLMSESDTVELDYHVYSDTTGNQNRVNFLQSSIDDATAGTDLEGKVTVNLVVDEQYYDNCMSGLCDIAFTAWGGEDMNPYAMMQCYTDPTLNLVYGYDAESEELTINVDGEDITMSAYDWYYELCEGEYATAELDTRNQILAGMEEGILSYYGMAPLAYLNEATLYSQRIMLGSETYVNSLVGFGGIEDMTYTMNDEEWDAYCADQNNQLTY